MMVYWKMPKGAPSGADLDNCLDRTRACEANKCLFEACLVMTTHMIDVDSHNMVGRYEVSESLSDKSDVTLKSNCVARVEQNRMVLYITSVCRHFRLGWKTLSNDEVTAVIGEVWLRINENAQHAVDANDWSPLPPKISLVITKRGSGPAPMCTMSWPTRVRDKFHLANSVGKCFAQSDPDYTHDCGHLHDAELRYFKDRHDPRHGEWDIYRYYKGNSPTSKSVLRVFRKINGVDEVIRPRVIIASIKQSHDRINGVGTKFSVLPDAWRAKITSRRQHCSCLVCGRKDIRYYVDEDGDTSVLPYSTKEDIPRDPQVIDLTEEMRGADHHGSHRESLGVSSHFIQDLHEGTDLSLENSMIEKNHQYLKDKYRQCPRSSKNYLCLKRIYRMSVKLKDEWRGIQNAPLPPKHTSGAKPASGNSNGKPSLKRKTVNAKSGESSRKELKRKASTTREKPWGGVSASPSLHVVVTGETINLSVLPSVSAPSHGEYLSVDW